MANTVRVGTQVTGVGKSSSDLDKLRDKFEKLQKQGAKGIGIGIGVGAATKGLDLLGGALGGIGDAIGDAISKASDLDESMSKANVVFGDSVGVIADFGATSAASFGLSKNAAYEATGTFGNLFKSMGLGQDAAADMSVDITKLAADLASFNNVGIDEALLALRSGLVGEAEPMRKFGVLLNEASVKAQGMKMGIAGAKGEMTEAAKVQARYALIIGQTGTAQGDFARTSDGLANTQRILDAQLEDVTTTIGQQLLPVILGLATAVKDNLVPAIDAGATVVGAFGNVADAVVMILDPFAYAMRHAKEEAERLANEGLASATEKLRIFNQNLPVAAEETKNTAAATDTFASSLDEAKRSWEALNDRLKARNEFEDLPDRITVAAAEVRTAQNELNAALKKTDEAATAAARLRLRAAERDLVALQEAWAALRREMAKPVKVGGTYHPGGTNAERRHSGGPVTANTPYIIGKPGAEELFVPGRSGVVIPPGVSGGRPLAGGVGDIHVHIGSFYGTQQNIADLSREIGQQVRLQTVKGAA